MNDIMTLVSQHKWIPLAALVIGFTVRLLKSDTKIPINIPPQWRVWLAIGLGCASGVLEAVTTGKGWTESIVGGLISTALAVLGQNAIIDSARGGKEFVIPGLIIPGATPAPGKPVSLKPPPLPAEASKPSNLPPTLSILFFLGALGTGSSIAIEAACNPAQRIDTTNLLLKETQCALAHMDLPDDQILLACALDPGAWGQIVNIIRDARAQKAKAAADAHSKGLAEGQQKASCSGADGGAR